MRFTKPNRLVWPGQAACIRDPLEENRCRDRSGRGSAPSPAPAVRSASGKNPKCASISKPVSQRPLVTRRRIGEAVILHRSPQHLSGLRVEPHQRVRVLVFAEDDPPFGKAIDLRN
jgi:hypothetical protein